MGKSETTAAYWQRIGQEWGPLHPDALWRAHSDAVNRKLLSRWLPAGTVPRLLKTDLFDEAAGDGLYPLLQSLSQTVVGIDLSLRTAQTARERFGDRPAACADVRLLPFPGEVFDVIVSNSTLDHFPSEDDLVSGVRELCRILRPGGHLLLTLDNQANPVVWLRNLIPFRLLHRLGLVPYYVGATFGPSRLRRVLQELSLEVLELGAVLHCPRAPAVGLARWLQRHAGEPAQLSYLKWLMRCESLSRWPTRFLTGHFVAALARRSG